MSWLSHAFHSITHAFSSILSPILGGGGESQQVVQPKTVEQPTIVDNGEAEGKALQDNRNKRAKNKGFTTNILAGDIESGETGKKNLLGE